MKSYQVYECDSCGGLTRNDGSLEARPWECPVCGKETCSKCYSRCAVCNQCASILSPDECLTAARKRGWLFDED